MKVRQHSEPGTFDRPKLRLPLSAPSWPEVIADVADTSIDPALSVQLTEATHALYRAAIALEGVQSTMGEGAGVRCPFLAEYQLPDPGHGPGSMLTRRVSVDDPLSDIAEANDKLCQLEIPGLGPSGTRTADDPTTWNFDHDTVSTHELRNEEFLQELTEDLNAVVIHGVFETGLALHGALERTTDPDAKRLIEVAIATLDETIQKTRSTFFDRG